MVLILPMCFRIFGESMSGSTDLRWCCQGPSLCRFVLLSLIFECSTLWFVNSIRHHGVDSGLRRHLNSVTGALRWYYHFLVSLFLRDCCQIWENNSSDITQVIYSVLFLNRKPALQTNSKLERHDQARKCRIRCFWSLSAFSAIK